MALNSTGPNRFTIAGRQQTDFYDHERIARVTFHYCEMAPLTSQTLAHAIFSLSV